jgi:hypothetical protein
VYACVCVWMYICVHVHVHMYVCKNVNTVGVVRGMHICRRVCTCMHITHKYMYMHSEKVTLHSGKSPTCMYAYYRQHSCLHRMHIHASLCMHMHVCKT